MNCIYKILKEIKFYNEGKNPNRINVKQEDIDDLEKIGKRILLYLKIKKIENILTNNPNYAKLNIDKERTFNILSFLF